MLHFGTKAFATAGGQVKLFGIHPDCSTWGRVRETVQRGSRTILLEPSSYPRSFASCWSVGDTIVVASTDYDRDQAEKVEIVSIFDDNEGTTITVDQDFVFEHYGELQTFGQYTLDERGEVALLSRSIHIHGEDAASNDNNIRFGGHFIIMHTAEPQQVTGVELWKMGQETHLGRYPMHFHMNSHGGSGMIASHNSIHDTFQRAYVTHGTFNMMVKENVAFETRGVRNFSLYEAYRQ